MGLPFSESTEINNFIKNTLSKEEIVNIKFFCEQMSHDTLSSIFFIGLLYVEPLNIRKITFITSDFHISRVKVILNEFKRMGFYKNCDIFYKESFSSYCHTHLESRVNHETDATVKILNELKFLRNKTEFIVNFITNHSCFNCNFNGRIIDGNELY
jgi:hypothetical protein